MDPVADLWSPAEPSAPTAAGGNLDQLQSSWDQYLADPRGRASLASFGLAMMQPVGFGQTGAGHFAQALGEAGNSARTTEALDLKQTESESKNDLRGAQADAATARSATAAANANTASERLRNMQLDTESKINLRKSQADTNATRAQLLQAKILQLEAITAVYPDDHEAKLQLDQAKTELIRAQTELTAERTGIVGQDANSREERAKAAGRNANTRAIAEDNKTLNPRVPSDTPEGKNQRNQLSNALRAQNLYRLEVEAIKKRNADITNTGPKEEIPTYQNWLSRNPDLQQRLQGNPPASGTAPPAAQPAPVPPTPAAPVTPGAPVPIIPKSQRQVGQTYPTDAGPKKWTGTGWVDP